MHARIIIALDRANFEHVGGGQVLRLGAEHVARARAELPDIPEAEVPIAMQQHEEDLIRAALAEGGALRVSGARARSVVGVPQRTICGRCVVRLMTREIRPLPIGHTLGAAGQGTEVALVSPIAPDVEARLLVLGQNVARAVAGLERE
jgi:hypothetical protein